MILLKSLSPFDWEVQALYILCQYSVSRLISTGHGGSGGCTHVLDVSRGLFGSLQDHTIGPLLGIGVHPRERRDKGKEKRQN